MGVIAYLVKTNDRAALSSFIEYVKAQKQPIPSAQNPIDEGYKTCPIDVSQTCLIGSGGWRWLAYLANAWGIGGIIPPEYNNISQDFGYTPSLTEWLATFNLVGFRFHLIGIELLIAQKLGISDAHYSAAAKQLAAYFPDNPFYLYLWLGRDQRVLDAADKKCGVDPSQTEFDRWSWEVPEEQQAWKIKMGWDCIFIYRLLSSN